MTILNLIFYVDLETSSKMKLICVHTHYYWSIPFSAVNSIFYNFFTCVPHICSWSTSYTFLQVQPSKDFITIWYLTEVYFLGWAVLQLHLWIHIYVVPFKGPLHLWLQSHISLMLDDEGSTPSLDPSPVLFIPILFALYLHKPYIFIFQMQFWKPWLTIWSLLFYVDLETSSKMKFVWLHTHYYWSIPFSAANSILFYFFTCMLDIYSWSANNTLLQVLPSKVF